jgi:putative colanic acid biosynthesis acetyltransferase WcaF
VDIEKGAQTSLRDGLKPRFEFEISPELDLKKKARKKIETVELRGYSSHFPLGLRVGRVLWGLVWTLFFRPSPFPLHGWRRMLLRLFGAQLGPEVHVYPSVRVWAPWNLTMAEGSSLGPWVDCYCVDKIELGDWAVVSQRSYLCSATHDIRSPQFELKTAPIRIGARAWVAAEAFVGPGVTIGEGAVVAARAVAVKSVAPWSVVAGTPAKEIAKRKISGREAKN